MKNKYVGYVLAGLIVVALFAMLAQVSQVYEQDLQNIVLSAGVFAPILYIAIGVASIVLAPLSSLFLLPVAANVFGPMPTVLYSIISWLVGSLIAFYLAKEYGHGKIKEVYMCRKIKSIERTMTQRQIYLLIILLRMALPADVLSYALGLFTTISYKTFMWTTLVGIIPFAFLFSYSSILPVEYQVGVGVFSIGIFIAAVYYLVSYKTKEIK